jgi:DNA-binding IclR family transcriptional regulator
MATLCDIAGSVKRSWNARISMPPIAYRVPVIERMVEVLAQLERADGHPTVRDLATSSGVPRSTVYRILNTLEAHRLVVRVGSDGGYQLGSRLVTLAANVPRGAQWRRVAESSQPWLERLASDVGETVKLSVLDADAALCIAVARGPSPFTVAAALGGRYPLHAGAASKILLAAMDSQRRDELFQAPLASYTQHTINDPRILREQLARIRRQGIAEDRGEFNLSIGAVGAPVKGVDGEVVAAVSIAHFADRTAADRLRYRAGVRRAARAIALALS